MNDLTNGRKTSMAVFCALLLLSIAIPSGAETANGSVFDDRNSNALRDDGEPGVPEVAVSNGRDVARTDAAGRWSLPITDDTILFVVKPSGWAVPLGLDRLPKYYYSHKPNGSPKLAVAGVEPTGPLPASVDFPLRKHDEPDKFKIVVMADPQARGLREVDFIFHDIVEEMMAPDSLTTGAAFGWCLGDIVADDAGLFETINSGLVKAGFPWYAVPGNHDTNRDATEDRFSDETFERVYGPGTYALEWAKVVFIGYDDYFANPGGRNQNLFSEDQLAFTKAYLEGVPQDRLIVLGMHIPIVACGNRDELFRILESRPYAFSISGHTHTQENLLLGPEQGWKGKEPHHHLIAGTASGSWWCGLTDETGIPHATMNDGVPNGYSIVSFDGNRYSVRFKAARRPADYQMNVYCPDVVEKGAAEPVQILVNFFSGGMRSKMELRLDEGEWRALEQTRTTDPACARMHALSKDFDQKTEELLGWKMDSPSMTSHMWTGPLPMSMAAGTHTIEVRATDQYGQIWTAKRLVRVE